MIQTAPIIKNYRKTFSNVKLPQKGIGSFYLETLLLAKKTDNQSGRQQLLFPFALQ